MQAAAPFSGSCMSTARAELQRTTVVLLHYSRTLARGEVPTVVPTSGRCTKAVEVCRRILLAQRSSTGKDAQAVSDTVATTPNVSENRCSDPPSRSASRPHRSGRGAFAPARAGAVLRLRRGLLGPASSSIRRVSRTSSTSTISLRVWMRSGRGQSQTTIAFSSMRSSAGARLVLKARVGGLTATTTSSNERTLRRRLHEAPLLRLNPRPLSCQWATGALRRVPTRYGNEE